MNIKNTILTSKVNTLPSCVDTLAFYDEESNKIAVISVKDYKNYNLDNYTIINKTSELSDYSSLKLINLNSFISKNPTSNIETYIASAHSDRVIYNFDFYVTAYITLYRNYKSLETLTANNFITFIDTFIDNCVSMKSDHPGSICYFNNDINKILKLRKTVFTMFRDYINNYDNYLNIYRNQNEYNYTDRQFRVFLNTLKAFSKAQTAERNRFIETLEAFSDSEAA